MMEPNKQQVGQRIKKIREEILGVSMSKFGSIIDNKAKSGTVANWETGKNLPNHKRLIRIAELGGKTVEELLYGSAKQRISNILLNSIDENCHYYDEDLYDYISEYLSSNNHDDIKSFILRSVDDFISNYGASTEDNHSIIIDEFFHYINSLILSSQQNDDRHQTDFQKLDSILLGISIQAEKDYIALENSDEDPLVLGDLLNNISYVDITTQYRRELIRRQPLEYSFYVFDHIIYILKPINELSDDDYKIDLNYFTGIQVIHEDPITLEKDIILDEDLTSSKQVVDIIRQHWGDIIYLYFEGREWGWKNNINNKQTLKEVFLTTKYGFENEQILDYRYPIEY